MSHDQIMELISWLLPILFGLFGIKIGGASALRAAAVAQQPKTKFPWKDVVTAVLELLLKIISMNGVLKKKDSPSDGGARQN